MKVSDYIVKFLVDRGITDAFGYPGGSVTNLMDSFRKNEKDIKAHVMYHEQAAAFAACAYAETKGVPGIAYATGGPGATNLLTGIGHAFYDSIPVIFLTGNVNTYEAKGDLLIRQRGFQESDNVSVAQPLTKFSAYIDRPEKIRYYLEKAFYIATSDRPGPVLLDLPMDVQRAEVKAECLEEFIAEERDKDNYRLELPKTLISLLKEAKKPCLILGSGVKKIGSTELVRRVIDNLKIPYVTSMIAFDILERNRYYQGFIGAYGDRSANFVIAKSDLVISLGARLDVRQVGAIRNNFAPNAKIIRVDIDKDELRYKVHPDEYSFCMKVEEALEILIDLQNDGNYEHWLSVCQEIKQRLAGYDNRLPNDFMEKISECILERSIITTDVGQNQVWVAQSLVIKKGQKVLFSGGMGAMGHALPAAIGAYYGSGGEKVICICGDGGLQMNIQELQFVARENLPIKIIVFNNNALGMIRHFQEMYFDGIYYQTNPSGGYIAPDFCKIAFAYGIRQVVVEKLEDIEECREVFKDDFPILIEIRIFEDTYVLPKLEYGKPNQDQQPLIDRKLYQQLMEL